MPTMLAMADGAHILSLLVSLGGSAMLLSTMSDAADSLVGPSVREMRWTCCVGIGIGVVGLALEVAASAIRLAMTAS